MLSSAGLVKKIWLLVSLAESVRPVSFQRFQSISLSDFVSHRNDWP